MIGFFLDPHIISETGGVKKTVPKWRDARGNILNLSYAYVSCAYEFKLRGRLSVEF